MATDIAAAHFAAILDAAKAARDKIDEAAEADPGDDFEPLLDADDRVENLLALILDSPVTPRVMLALGGTGQAGPAGAA